MEYKSDIDVELIQSMGGDQMVVAAAKVSTSGTEAKKLVDQGANAGLINYLIKHRHGCYDEQTEVLTKDGWKLWKDIKKTDLFASVNLKTKVFEYQKSSRIIKKYVDEELIKINTNFIDLLVTQDHNLIVDQRTKNGYLDNWHLQAAQSCFNTSYKLPLSFNINKKSKIDLTDQECQFIGFSIADGYCKSSTPSFHLKKKRKIEYLKSLGFNISDGKNSSYFVTGLNKRIKNILKESYTENGKRCMPASILTSLSPHQAYNILYGYLIGDGHFSSNKHWTFSSSSQKLIDDLQHLAAIAGLNIKQNKTQRSDAFNKNHISYRAGITLKQNTELGKTLKSRNKQFKKIKYKGYVYCCTVPNNTLYIRRNGKCCWCGNSPFEHSSLTFFVHAPIFVWREWHRHRVGFCLAGDTQIWGETLGKSGVRTSRKQTIERLYNNWNNGVTDCLGRTRFLPSVYNQTLRVLNENTNIFERGNIKDVFQSGIKECYLLEIDHAKDYYLKCSKDHRILTSEGWTTVENLSGNELIAVTGKINKFKNKNMPPSLRQGIGVWTSMQRNELISLEDKCYICNNIFARKNLQLDHVIPVVKDILKALDKTNLKPICKTCHRSKTSTEQKLSPRCIVAGKLFAKLKRKPVKCSEEMTYDIEMKGPWHNFIANGIVVHNSYNEESGRYKTLEPVFYIPDRDRPMMKVEEWKAARPKFTRCENDSTYNAICFNLKKSYKVAYESYLDNLKFGIDPGLARDCLPVGIYSSCWVTMNPRSLMHFLSLRTHNVDALHVSYPLYEIEEAAKSIEKIFAKGWPLTYEAFNKNGRHI